MPGSLRLCLNADFDRIHELANQHRNLRLMLGIADWDKKTFPLQTLRNVHDTAGRLDGWTAVGADLSAPTLKNHFTYLRKPL